MTIAILAWLSMVAYAAHILEEYTFNWRDWARGALGLPVEWSDFYVTNSVVVALGIAQAMLAPMLVLAPMTYAALMIINAIFFHILPLLRSGGRFSPGLFTAVTLFLPLGIATEVVAMREAGAGGFDLVVSGIAGALLMAYPVVMLKLKSHPYFVQTSDGGEPR